MDVSQFHENEFVLKDDAAFDSFSKPLSKMRIPKVFETISVYYNPYLTISQVSFPPNFLHPHWGYSARICIRYSNMTPGIPATAATNSV